MDTNLDLNKVKNIHFIGVGGVSMSGLARHFLSLGKVVSGSDNSLGDNIDSLKALGVKVFLGHDAKNVIGADVVVVSSAISSDNVELLSAMEKGILTVKRSHLLGKVISCYDKSIAVSGSHGKTTVTAMIGHVLLQGGKDPFILVGGCDACFGNYRKGSGEYVVAEACEYKRNFLDIFPKIAVVLNVDNDHGESYSGMVDMVNCFKQFAKNSISVINADDKYAKDICNSTTITFGINNLADYYAKNVKKEGAGYSFIAYAHNFKYGKIKLSIPGEHNVYNALATFAVGDLCGVSFSKIKRAIESFCSVQRRNEYLGKFLGLDCYADYAHHPSEIGAMIKTFSEDGCDFIAVFQPHTYSRTKLLVNEFVNALSRCENLIIYKTYGAREDFDQLGSAKALCNQIKKASKKEPFYVGSSNQLERVIGELADRNKRVVFLGAGDIYDIAKQIVSKKTMQKKDFIVQKKLLKNGR